MLTEPTQHARPLLGDVGVGAGITQPFRNLDL